MEKPHPPAFYTSSLTSPTKAWRYVGGWAMCYSMLMKTGKKSPRPDNNLCVGRVLAEFHKAEKSTAPRKGTFKIAAPFEEALDTILKAPHESKPKQLRKK